ncbi:hypothetical protein QQF64_000035, partial [Cirrhinus molitorella]
LGFEETVKRSSSSVKTYCSRQGIMGLEAIYENIECRDIENTTGPQTLSHNQDEGKDLKRRGSRCLVLIALSLGLICVLLLVFIILQHITITAERDLIKSYKNTAEDFNQTINSLQDNYTDLMTEKHQLQNNFSSCSHKNIKLESRVEDLTAEKDHEELKKEASKRGWFFISTELKSWSDSRQYCRDHGGDLVIINSEEKQRFISSFTVERVWIGLSDREQEGKMTWVDNSPLKQGFWLKGGSRCLVLITVSLGLICVLQLVFIIQQHITITAERDLIKSYKNTVEELKNNYTDLMTEKHQLQNKFSSLNQKNLELESNVTSLSGHMSFCSYGPVNNPPLQISSSLLYRGLILGPPPVPNKKVWSQQSWPSRVLLSL